MSELVIFDVDGLMIDTESVWKNAFDKAGDKYGISNLGDTLFPSLIGKRLEDVQVLYLQIDCAFWSEKFFWIADIYI